MEIHWTYLFTHRGRMTHICVSEVGHRTDDKPLSETTLGKCFLFFWLLGTSSTEILSFFAFHPTVASFLVPRGCHRPKKSWWRHQMETFSALLALCAGNSPVPVTSPHKGQWRGALMFTLICARINDWVNNREAGGLRRLLDHYDVSVMYAAGLFVTTYKCSGIKTWNNKHVFYHNHEINSFGEVHTLQI